jgi:hypothetical protein
MLSDKFHPVMEGDNNFLKLNFSEYHIAYVLSYLTLKYHLSFEITKQKKTQTTKESIQLKNEKESTIK